MVKKTFMNKKDVGNLIAIIESGGCIPRYCKEHLEKCLIDNECKEAELKIKRKKKPFSWDKWDEVQLELGPIQKELAKDKLIYG